MSQRNILDYPLGVFRFHVNFTLARPNGTENDPRPLCGGAFSECTGLEATLEPKSIKVGGVNYGETHRAGRVTFATVVLKRGVSKNRDLWNWFHLVAGGGYAYRLNAEITQMGFNAQQQEVPVIIWRMKNALPTKFRTADYNATFTQIAIEELHFVHEGLTQEAAQAAT